jgi:hypothetical protein
MYLAGLVGGLVCPCTRVLMCAGASAYMHALKVYSNAIVHLAGWLLHCKGLGTTARQRSRGARQRSGVAESILSCEQESRLAYELGALANDRTHRV